MKKTKFTLLLLATLSASLLLPTTSAEKPDFMLKASGDLIEYKYGWTAEILEGKWSVHVSDGDPAPGPYDPVVKFKAQYLELNLDEIEGSPVGTVDKFWWNMENIVGFDIDPVPGGDPDPEPYILYLNGDIRVKKASWRLDSGKYEVYEYIWYDVVITIDRETGELLVDLPVSAGQDWDIAGTTTKISYYSLIG
jgi:hypothetical protein